MTVLTHPGSVLIIKAWFLLREYAVTILSDISLVFFSQTVWFMSMLGWLSWSSFSTAPLINSALFSDRQLCPQMHKTAMCFMANFTRGRIYWSTASFLVSSLVRPSSPLLPQPPLWLLLSPFISHRVFSKWLVCVCVCHMIWCIYGICLSPKEGYLWIRWN